MTHARTLLVAATACLLQACASAPSAEQTFTGWVESGGDSLPVTTVLVGNDGGRYVFVEPGNIAVPGTLGPCRQVASHTLNCVWTDRYGRGQLQMTFAPDGRSFEGRWALDGAVPGDDPPMRWTGAR